MQTKPIRNHPLDELPLPPPIAATTNPTATPAQAPDLAPFNATTINPSPAAAELAPNGIPTKNPIPAPTVNEAPAIAFTGKCLIL